MSVEHLPHREIGGYFELELGEGDFIHERSVLLNSGRACLEYLMKARGTKHVYVPIYTCDAMLEPIHRLGISYSFYSVDHLLEISPEIRLRESEQLIYVNYFGLKDQYCRDLAGEYGSQLILDCSQAYFFLPPEDCHVFYSPRKFLGVPDGGCLYTDRELPDALEMDVSFERFSHLVKRIDLGAEAAYSDFRAAEASFDGLPVKRMSRLTSRILRSIDHQSVLDRRRSNYAHLQSRLQKSNRFPVAWDSSACPMVYPFLGDDETARSRLIDDKVFVPTYWPDVLTRSSMGEMENVLSRKLLPLPIDQRYGEADMDRIAALIG